MNLTRFAITRPLAMLMFILGVVLAGALSYTRLPVDRLPQISFPFVSVNVSYPGASPEDVESLILQPIEDALAGVPGMYQLRATAREGSGNVSLQLVEGADVDKALLEVQRRVASIRNQLPKDANDPRVNKFDPNASPIMNLALTGPDLEATYNFATDVLQPKLLSLNGVADVNVNGGLKRQIQVRLDPAKMATFGVSVDTVSQALTRENLSTPAGSLDQGSRNLSVRSLGLFQSAADLNNLIVTTAKDGAPIFLRNLATVQDTYANQTNHLRYNGVEAVGLSILKQSDANTLQVAEAVRVAMDKMRSSLPPDSALDVVNDSSRFVRRSLDAVQFDLGLAIFLTASVLMIFLHSWRNTVVVLLAIPTSLISTFLVMSVMGFSLNLMSLMALAMTIGILVDDSIVVLENIHRHLQLGETPRDAAMKGRSEIGMAAIAITFTDVVVYLPVAFMQGNIGQLFRQYGLTIATATLFSLIVSFTLTPMLASRWLKHADEHGGGGIFGWFARGFEARFSAIASGYGRALGVALGLRPLVVVFAGVLLVASISVLPLRLLSSEYTPQEDDGSFQVSITMPVGTSLASSDDASKMLEKSMAQIPEIRNVYASVGGQGGGQANLQVEAVEKSKRSRPLEAIMADTRKLAALVPDARVQTSVSNPLSGGRNFINIDILGDDYNTLSDIAGQVVEVAQSIRGIPSAQSSFQQQQPELRFTVDRERAAALGVSTTQISSALRSVIQGTVVSQLRVEGETAVDILLTSQSGVNTQSTALGSVPVGTPARGLVPLSQVTKVRPGRAPVQITRVDRKRSVQVSAAVTDRPVGDVATDLRASFDRLVLPTGYRLDLRGTVQQLDAAIAALTAALGLSILLIYMTLVALYESWLYPAAIMFSLPVSVVGAFGGLMLTGNTLNIFSMIGMIALMGLAAKNAILLVDYTGTLRARGYARNAALMEAGRTRLRPIVMTSCTVIAAMSPLVAKLEAGAESRAPMAVVIIGGVVSSTLLTLFVVPVMYTLLDDMQARFHLPIGFRWPWRRQQAAPGAGLAGEPAHRMPAPAAPLVPQHASAATQHASVSPVAQVTSSPLGTNPASLASLRSMMDAPGSQDLLS